MTECICDTGGLRGPTHSRYCPLFSTAQETAKRNPSDWIDRVREADAEAEEQYQRAVSPEGSFTPSIRTVYALAAIAAELRAQRIARRPGAGR